MGSMMADMGVWSAAGVLVLVLVLAAVAAGAWSLGRSAAPGRAQLPAGGRTGQDPVEILRRRYAAGEIDEDEFWQRMSGITAR